MTSTTAGIAATTLDLTAESRVDAAARHLYDQEVALHYARQTDVNEWIAAATSKLHDAILEHIAAVTEARALAAQ